MNHVPWIDELALKEWDRIVAEGPRPFNIFEWGSGESTIWVGSKRVGDVWSVEYDINWYFKIKQQLSVEKLDNVFIIYRYPIPEVKCFHSLSIPNMNFEGYINAISEIPKKYNMILVDGRARVLCFKKAMGFLENNGCIVLHDAERAEYNACREVANSNGLKTWEIKESRSTLICQKIAGTVL